MYRLIVLFLICYGVQTQNNGDIESIIKQIFGDPKNPIGPGANTGGMGPNTGGMGPNTGGMGPNTGGMGPNTGGMGPNTGGMGPTTGGMGPSTVTDGPKDFNLNPSPTGTDPVDTSCKTQSGEVGECVTYYLCSANNSIITDGVGIIDIRVNDGPCEGYLDACCRVADQRPVDNPILPPPAKTEDVRAGCGWRNPNGVGFQIKGDQDNEAKFGEFPWVVAILKIEPVRDDDPTGAKLNVYVGGGSLIHPSVVMTAAHYVSKNEKVRVRVGEWDTQTKKEIYPYQERDIVETIIHKDFNGGNLFYDIALLILDTPVTMAPNVAPVCLPAAGDSARGGTRCFASGWGKDQFGQKGKYQLILKRLELPVVDRNQCEAELQKTRLGKHFRLHSSFMCAGGEPGMDTCKGDGGSPLVCPMQYDEGRYQQNGIVAWGIGCGENGVPGVYVDVANLRDWIDDNVVGRGFQTSSYTA